MAIIGPGAQQEIPTDIRPLLEGVSEFEFVTLLNPLSDDFAVRVGQDVSANMPFNIGQDTSGRTAQITNDERGAAQVYGLNLKNPDYKGKKHVAIDTVIPAGQTRRFKGNEAQVAIRQLTNEIMQREGNVKAMADPQARSVVEDRIIKGRGSIQDLMDSQMQTPRSQADEAIKKANEVQHEQAFPGLEQRTEEVAAGSDQGGTEVVQPERRGPGRPKQP